MTDRVFNVLFLDLARSIITVEKLAGRGALRSTKGQKQT
jgi:hypothetical protein